MNTSRGCYKSEAKVVTDDSLWENACMCGNILVEVGMKKQQSERADVCEIKVQQRATEPRLPVAQRAMNVSVCLQTIACLSLGRGSRRMMCSIKSLGMTEAMFHFNFPRTTSSHSYSIKKQVSRLKTVILD